MVKVENKETIRLLAKRFFKWNRPRNIIAVLAIMLTTLLFTSLFMGCQSLVLSKRATENEQTMCSSHAILQNMGKETDAQILEALKHNSDIDRFGTGVFLGSGMGEEYAFSVEVRYGDENMAESFNCHPGYGRMPEAYDEIALSSLILDAWGIPHKLGETIQLEWEQKPGKTVTDTFQVVGWWEGDKAVLAQLAWVSKAYADKNAFDPKSEDVAYGTYNGSRDYCVWFKNLWKLSEKTARLSREAGFSEEEGGFSVNPSYDMEYEDSISPGAVVFPAVFIVLAGFLIIYNIFSISVKTDIRAYGLLKNVGTTGKQLNRIVRIQALYLSAIGIPIGLFAGFAASRLMAPVLIENEIRTEAGPANQVVVYANPWIFVLAALLTLFTVYLSVWPACTTVKKLSPVEALRMADSDETRRKLKRSASAGWFAMALQNVLRNWKKGIVVMASIAFSLVVVNCIAILVQGYDFDMFKKIFLEADFQIDKLKNMPNVSDTSVITPKMRQTLEECPYKEEIGYVYYSEGQYAVDPALKQSLQEDAAQNEPEWNDWQKDVWKSIQEKNAVNAQVFGINEMIFHKLEWETDALSWEDFQTGEYAIIYYVSSGMYEPVFYCPPGDEFHFEYPDGTSRDYKSFGAAQIPYALDYPFAYMMGIKILLPEEEYIRCTGNEGAMRAVMNSQKKKERKLKAYLADTIQKEDDFINIFSVLDMQQSFARFVDRYYIIGGILAFILAFIGVMNFFNTMSVSMVSRKRELALLEAIGMTKPQIIKMLMGEGCIYLLGALLLAVCIVQLGAEYLISHTVGLTWYFHLHVTALPCLVLLPALLLIAVLIPGYQYRKIFQASIVDRLRM